MSEQNTNQVEQVVEQEVKAENVDNKPNEELYTKEQLEEIVAKNVDRAVAKAYKKAEEEKKEAERLAKLSAEDRAKEELKLREDSLSQKEAELNLRELKAQAREELQTVGLSKDLSELLDYKDAETVKSSIELLKKAVEEEAERKVVETLKGRAPTLSQDTQASAWDIALKNY